MHSLLPSPAEITTGSLWRARLHSPPSLLTNTFRHSHRAKHSRSCLGQLLQLPKILSQRAPTTIMPTFNCGGSVNHLLSSCLLSQASPSPHLSETAQVTGGDGTPSTAPKTSTPHVFLTDLSLLCPRSCCWFWCGVFRYPHTPAQQSCGHTDANPALLQ